jgi:hypothetical protein
MRTFILALLALGLPFTLAACADSAQEEAAEEAVEEGAPPGDQEDVIGDGEIIDEPGEPEGNFMTYDSDGDGMMNADEFGASMSGAAIADYDTDGDGMVSQAEYDAYVAAHP